MSSEERAEAAPQLFADRVKVYPKAVQGRVRTVKWAVLILCLAIYYLVPWLRWDRGPGLPDQAVLVDMAGRRAYLFGLEIWPQEIYLLAGLLILAAVALFLVTSLFGRLWCGFSCPQTVWTDLFLLVERRIEGDRNARMRLDSQPWSAAKIWRKSAKHAVWLLIAAATGGAWIMYYVDAPTMTVQIATGAASPAVYFFFGLFTLTTYVLAGWAREQVCTYMCPWPRFQSAMFDEGTTTVTYAAWRGEPRGKHKAGAGWEGRGDCVDCRACVNVCPTGIDIRDGLQMECISCGLCVDACNDVMGRLGRPPRLIGWDTEANQRARAEGRPPRHRLLRMRSAIYAGVLVALAATMAYALTAKSSLEIAVLRDRAPIYVTLSDGSIRNGYMLKLLNKGHDPRRFRVEVEGLPGAGIAVLGADGLPLPDDGLVVTAEGQSAFRLFLTLPREAVTEEARAISIRAVDEDGGEHLTARTQFSGPERREGR